MENINTGIVTSNVTGHATCAYAPAPTQWSADLFGTRTRVQSVPSVVGVKGVKAPMAVAIDAAPGSHAWSPPIC